MHRQQLNLIIISVLTGLAVSVASAHADEMSFPEFIGTDIPGAPILGPPILVMGKSRPVLTEKHGLAAPALWDWNGDGKRDLLLTDDFVWARDTEGTVLEVPQWCCIGFTPQFFDLDDDGHLDMITGQYHPGEVTLNSKVRYQTCKEDLCLPPRTENIETIVTVH